VVANRGQEPKKKNLLWYFGALGIFLFSQLKLIIPLLKFGKFGGALLSMFISIGAYALVAPWSFAIGLVLMLFIHEMGHVWAAKRKGLPVTAPVFIPFLGALITMKKNPLDAVTEAYIAFGGPLVGTAGALVAFLIGVEFNSGVLISISYIGFFLNLINLLPIHPLDGGRIATAVTRWLWLVGLVGGLVVIVYLKSILFFIIWAMFAYDLYKKYVSPNKKGNIVLQPHIEIRAQHLVAQGVFLPGKEHKRDLEFKTQQVLDEQGEDSQIVEITWESLDFHGRIPLPGNVVVSRVQVNGVDQVQREDGLHLIIHLNIECKEIENKQYFDVPKNVRLTYGSVYFGLALFLIFMMYQVHQVEGFITTP
jgi:Zn-dependent protease